MIRDDFIRDAMTTYGFAPGSEAALGEYFDVFQKKDITTQTSKYSYSNRQDQTEGSAVDQPPSGENA